MGGSAEDRETAGFESVDLRSIVHERSAVMGLVLSMRGVMEAERDESWEDWSSTSL